LAKHTPAEDERGSLARPPWLPDENKRRRVYLGRGKRQEKDDAGKHRADAAKAADPNGQGSVTSEPSLSGTSKSLSARDRAVGDRAIPDFPAKPGETPVSRPEPDGSAEPPPKPERVVVSRPEPEGIPEHPPEPTAAPEFRPKRVAVRYDPSQRLQHLAPPSTPEPPGPAMTDGARNTFPPPAQRPPHGLDVEDVPQGAPRDEQAIAAEPEASSARSEAGKPTLRTDQEVSQGTPDRADEDVAETEAPDTTMPPVGEAEPPAELETSTPAAEWAAASNEAELEPDSPLFEVAGEASEDAAAEPEVLEPEPDAFADLPASGEPAPDAAPGELDEIELRAAALLEQMAARRAQVPAVPKDTVPDSTLDDESDIGPEPLTAELPNEAETQVDSSHDGTESEVEAFDEPAAVDEAVDYAAETPVPPAEQQGRVAAAEDDAPEIALAAEPPAGEDVPTDDSVVSADAVEDSVADALDPVPPPAEEPSKAPPAARRPALPPWQMAGSMISVGFERPADHDREVPHEPPPAPEPPAASTPPSKPHSRPHPGTGKFRPGPGPGAGPPWPPPPFPGPFPPPPWWPGPPPAQRAQAKAPPYAPVGGRPPHSGPPPGPPRPPAGGPPPNYQAYRVPPSIDEAEITNPYRFAPPSGWRRLVHHVTGGHVNPGASRKERSQEHLLAEIRQPIAGDFRIAVLSIKGGVGKTTTTFGLGSALAMVRHDRVIAVDANPDRGTLAERVGDTSTTSTVRDLLSDPNIHRYADVRNHTLMAASRLEVLASEQDPAVAEVFGAEDYRRTVEILRYFYNVILTDCGTGIMHSAMSAILDLAHTIVLVSSPAIDAARSASATLDWLMQHGHSGLVREAHVVLSASRPGSAALKLDKVYEHFQTRCRSIHLIPFDPHLAEGADVDFARLRPPTRQAYLELAGAVAENFGRLRAPREQA
jgi:MinD-like ATPase involved in chromosome partitioning or flagellar assembly